MSPFNKKAIVSKNTGCRLVDHGSFNWIWATNNVLCTGLFPLLPTQPASSRPQALRPIGGFSGPTSQKSWKPSEECAVSIRWSITTEPRTSAYDCVSTASPHHLIPTSRLHPCPNKLTFSRQKRENRTQQGSNMSPPPWKPWTSANPLSLHPRKRYNAAFLYLLYSMLRTHRYRIISSPLGNHCAEWTRGVKAKSHLTGHLPPT